MNLSILLKIPSVIFIVPALLGCKMMAHYIFFFGWQIWHPQRSKCASPIIEKLSAPASQHFMTVSKYGFEMSGQTIDPLLKFRSAKL